MCVSGGRVGVGVSVHIGVNGWVYIYEGVCVMGRWVKLCVYIGVNGCEAVTEMLNTTALRHVYRHQGARI